LVGATPRLRRGKAHEFAAMVTGDTELRHGN
jgi:hypothetical protein